MMSKPFITVAICTRNRSGSLLNTLASLEKMKVPAKVDWEVIVVNNDSSDDTDQVIASFAGRLPIRSLLEPQQGHSNARNCAVAAARGAYILWTDDDVLVGDQWLAAYAKAFLAWPTDAVFGGPIVPQFEGNPPPWLTAVLNDDNIASVYAARDLGPEPVALSPDGNKIPYGANFAVRLQEQRQFTYDPRLGLGESGNIRGEETDVVTKILNSGASGRWVPAAAVRHFIPRRLQREAYLRDYFVGAGRKHARQAPRSSSPGFLTSARWLGRAIVSQFRYILMRPFSPPESWCRELMRASTAWGRLRESRALRRSISISARIPGSEGKD